MIDIERKKQQAINDFYETHCEGPHEIDLLFGFDSGYNLGLDERNQLAAQVERLREALEDLCHTASILMVNHGNYDVEEGLAEAKAALSTTNKSGGGDDEQTG